MKKVTKRKLKEAFARDFLHEHHFIYLLSAWYSSYSAPLISNKANYVWNKGHF